MTDLKKELEKERYKQYYDDLRNAGFSERETRGMINYYIDMSAIMGKEAVEVMAQNIIQFTKRQLLSGATEDQIIEMLMDDLENNGVIFNGMKGKLLAGARPMINEPYHRVYENRMYEDGMLQVWISVNAEAGKACPDCESNHLQEDTLEGWMDNWGGLPPLANTVCNLRNGSGTCYCYLEDKETFEEYKSEVEKPINLDEEV